MTASICRDSFFLPCCCHSLLKLVTARSSHDFACCLRAISMAFRKHASASNWGLGIRDWGLVTADLSCLVLDLTETCLRLVLDSFLTCPACSVSSPLSRYSSAS